jgi:hypothetical protein
MGTNDGRPRPTSMTYVNGQRVECECTIGRPDDMTRSLADLFMLCRDTLAENERLKAENERLRRETGHV